MTGKVILLNVLWTICVEYYQLVDMYYCNEVNKNCLIYSIMFLLRIKQLADYYQVSLIFFSFQFVNYLTRLNKINS